MWWLLCALARADDPAFVQGAMPGLPPADDQDAEVSIVQLPSPRTSGGQNGRSVLGPTAIPLGRGRGYLGQRELALTVVGVGLTDQWELSAAAVVPALFAPYTVVGAVGTKLSIPTGKFTTALGFEGFFLGGSTVACPYAVGTYSLPNANYSVGGGLGYWISSAVAPSAFGVGMFSGDWRVSKKVSILGELLVLAGETPAGDGTVLLPNAAARFSLGRWTIDAGLVIMDLAGARGGPVIPIPFFDFAYNWPNKSDPKPMLRSHRH